MSEHAKGTAGPCGSNSTRPAAQRIQTKLAVSDRHDPMEREADSVADRITAGQPAPAVSRMAAPEKKPEQAARQAQPEKKEKPVQLATKEERKPETPVQRAAAPEKKEPGVQRAAAPEKKKEPGVQRAGAPEKKEPKGNVQRVAAPEKKEPAVQRAAAPEKRETPVQRQADEREEVQTKSAGDGAGASMGHVAQQAVDSKGSGRPLDSGVRSRIESSLGADIGHVRVHDDPSARAAASALNARAFTHGSDIWMGPGESSSDVHLMAHEAAHVIQQGATAQRLVQRTNGSGAAPAGAPSGAFEVERFPLPTIKNRHRAVYERWAGSNALTRAAGYDRNAQGDPAQRDKWRDEVALPPATVLANKHIDLVNPAPKAFTLNGATVTLPGTVDELTERLKLPNWDRMGQPTRFEVDHIVELQVSGWPGSVAANELENMEMLDRRSNGSAGGSTRGAVRESVREKLTRNRASDPAPAPVLPADVDDVLDHQAVLFRGVGPGPSGSVSESDSRTWTRAEIEGGRHLEGATPVANVGQPGSPTSFAMVSPERTRVLTQYSQLINQPTIAVNDLVQQRAIPGLRITQIALVANYTDGAVTDIGNVHGFWDLPPQVVPANTAVQIPLRKHSQYAGYLGNLPGTLAGDVAGASPIEFSGLHIEGDRVVADGRLSPTIPLIANTPLELRLVGRDIELAYTYNSGELAIPIPGLTINDTSLSIFFGTRGLGAEGSVEFTVARVGGGMLTASLTSESGFEAAGRFSFDTKLFDVAEAEVWYRNRELGGRGTLRITDPEKIRGIRSAEVTATFSPTTLGATGTIVPSIPGIENVTLTAQYSEEEGLLIGGTVNLGAGTPGIISGTLDVQVRKRPGDEEYAVSATGTAVPAIPGLDTTLTVSYNEGALTISGSADYSRGMLSGGIDLGVTNREFDAAGQPTDEIGTVLRVYGGGSVTIRIAPWLEGTVGVHLLPNGEIELSGEIALPDQIEIFSRKQIDRSLLNIAVQAPIFPGIVAEIGGGLSAQAGIGPGVIDQLRLGITYNPAHEEQTHVTGDAHLNIPADAGLRLAVRAGIGLGITGASATGGLEIGGMLGLGGAAEAGVQVDWLPSTGLRIDAYGDIHAEPIFRFDISGYVSVRALGFEVYGNTWELASYEFGSNLRFGVRFPIHYVEGEPFDISLSDVEFTVPDIDPGELLSSLVDRIA